MKTCESAYSILILCNTAVYIALATEHEKPPIAAVLGFLGHKKERLFSFRADFHLPSELLQAKRTINRNSRTTVFTHFAIAYGKLDTVTVFHYHN